MYKLNMYSYLFPGNLSIKCEHCVPGTCSFLCTNWKFNY